MSSSNDPEFKASFNKWSSICSEIKNQKKVVEDALTKSIDAANKKDSEERKLKDLETKEQNAYDEMKKLLIRSDYNA